MSIYIDLSYTRSTNTDMVLCSSLGLDVTLALSDSKSQKISIVPVAEWL